jgi:hypothetical protein
MYVLNLDLLLNCQYRYNVASLLLHFCQLLGHDTKGESLIPHSPEAAYCYVHVCVHTCMRIYKVFIVQSILIVGECILLRMYHE